MEIAAHMSMRIAGSETANWVMEDQEAKSKGLAQANDVIGNFDELLGIWDDKADCFPRADDYHWQKKHHNHNIKVNGYHHTTYSLIRVVSLES